MKAYGKEIKDFCAQLPPEWEVTGAVENEIEIDDLDDFVRYDTYEIGLDNIWPEGFGFDNKELNFDTEFRKWKKTQSHVSCVVSIPKEQYDFVLSNIKNLKIKGLTVQKM